MLGANRNGEAIGSVTTTLSCPLTLQLVPLVVEDQHRVELVGWNLAQANVDTEVQSRAQVQGAPDEQTGFGGLRGVQFVLGAVVAATTIGSIGTQAWFAQFVAPERPVDEVTKGGLLRPLPR
jgi:hypothetical protein